jgi:hypothetical protein
MRQVVLACVLLGLAALPSRASFIASIGNGNCECHKGVQT